MREAAGLDAVLDEEQAEVLRFVTRMASAAECRDILDDAPAGAGVAFPPLKRRIRSIPPDKAAERPGLPASGRLPGRMRNGAGAFPERTTRMPAKADMDRSGSELAGDGVGGAALGRRGGGGRGRDAPIWRGAGAGNRQRAARRNDRRIHDPRGR